MKTGVLLPEGLSQAGPVFVGSASAADGVEAENSLLWLHLKPFGSCCNHGVKTDNGDTVALVIFHTAGGAAEASTEDS